jgi:hypothetical protein
MYGSTTNSAQTAASLNRLLTPPPAPPIIQRDPKRQSQMLMESKRRSLAIKDTDLLEQMLRGDLEGFEQYQPSEDEEEEESEEDMDILLNNSKILEESIRSSTPASTILIEQEEEEEITDKNDNKKGTNQTTSYCLTCTGFPCTFPCNHSSTNLLNNNNFSIKKNDDPFALFTGVTIVLGIASQLGISDDWTIPITLATLVSGFLYSGNKNKKNKKKN